MYFLSSMRGDFQLSSANVTLNEPLNVPFNAYLNEIPTWRGLLSSNFMPIVNKSIVTTPTCIISGSCVTPSYSKVDWCVSEKASQMHNIVPLFQSWHQSELFKNFILTKKRIKFEFSSIQYGRNVLHCCVHCLIFYRQNLFNHFL